MAAITDATGTQYPFQIVEGQMLPIQPVPDFFNRIGQTGSGYQTVATRAPISSIMAHGLFTSLDLARKFKNGVMYLKGSRCKWDDPMGYTWTVLVRDSIAVIRGGAYSGGGVQNAPYCVTVMLQLEDQGG